MNLYKKILPFFFSCALYIFVVGCAAKSEFDRKIIHKQGIPQNSYHALREVQWQLEAYRFKDDWISNFETERISVVFNRSPRINGFAGCNVFSAEYKLNHERISVSSIVATRKHCQSRGDIVMHTEANFLSSLENVTTYAIDNETLVMFNEHGKRVLFFKRKAE